MLDKQQLAELDKLLSTTNEKQKIWLAGYLAGLVGSSMPLQGASTTVDKKLNIYFATETGNSKHIAGELQKAAKGQGYKVNVVPFTKVAPKDIQSPAVFITSTHGDGEPPEQAKKFYDLLLNEKNKYQFDFAVLGLGDRSYKQFCQTAKVVEQELLRIGGQALVQGEFLDVDYADYIPAWIEKVLGGLEVLFKSETSASGINNVSSIQSAATVSGKGTSRLNPVKGKVQHIVNLNDIDSNKETYHIEISFTEDVVYLPGDSAGIILPGGETPRLYSIASALSAYPGQLHLTVALATHQNPDGSSGVGLCSGYLSKLKVGDEISFFIQSNRVFKLPEDSSKPMIFVGPGTGIAPFRAFIQERQQQGADGKNWLFFGAPKAHCDFLYQSEWQSYLEDGLLTKIDLAFSRDQKEKIYVQDRLRQKASEVKAWIDEGAVIYVCGSKSMGKDVDQVLTEILKDSKSDLDFLIEEGRYLKDVY
ncbi:MAG: diflavin oxidoreductase [Pseudobdellovibrionaceae bacterium]